MQKVINLLRGSARVRIMGTFPERFLNLCAQRQVAFWKVEWLDAHTLRLCVARKDVKLLEGIAQRTMCDLTVERLAGVPYFLSGFRRRYALLIGLALSLVAACVLSQFILTFEVVGNKRVPSSVILSELHRHGVSVGTYGPAIDERTVSHKMLISLRDLSFFSINLHGTRAEIIVRENDPAPELLDESIPTNVISGATGIITRMEVLSGQARYKEGDTVLEGEVLISGVVDLQEPPYSTGDLGVMLVHAQGNVYARTWRTLKAVIPVEADVKLYTGQEKAQYFAVLLGRRVNFYRNGGISFAEYDKISKNKVLRLPGDTVLPFSLGAETFRAYTTESAPIHLEAAESILKQRLDETVHAIVGEGEVLHTSFSSVKQNGLLTVTLLAECSEQIARVVPMERPAYPAKE